MHVRHITGTVVTPIVMGVGAYGDRLTIAASGVVATTQISATAIYALAGPGAAHVVNQGQVVGGIGMTRYYGYAGGAGIAFGIVGTLANQGEVTGGKGAYGAYYGGGGGTGVVLLHGGMVSNAATVIGGDGGISNVSEGFGGNGGMGIDLAAGGTLANRGMIDGGAGGLGHFYGGNGGTGVSVGSIGTISNSGTIIGGAAGRHGGYPYGADGLGGVGVLLAGSGTLLNRGLISGGSTYNAHGSGVGVVISGNGMVTNAGTILGGAGRVGRDHRGGPGGAGVTIDGGTLVNTGTIIGGAPGRNGSLAGDAVQFGSHAGTLVISGQSVFQGDIVANPDARDVLLLDAGEAGTLSGLGSIVTGFNTIDEADGARWSLIGSTTGNGLLVMGSDARLSLSGAAGLSALSFNGGDTLTLESPAQFTSTLSGFGTGDWVILANVQADSLSYHGGTLTLFGADDAVVDTLRLKGKYSNADFMLKSVGHNTEVLFVGTGAALQDFLPPGIGVVATRSDRYGVAMTGPNGAVALPASPDHGLAVHFSHPAFIAAKA